MALASASRLTMSVLLEMFASLVLSPLFLGAIVTLLCYFRFFFESSLSTEKEKSQKCLEIQCSVVLLHWKSTLKVILSFKINLWFIGWRLAQQQTVHIYNYAEGVHESTLVCTFPCFFSIFIDTVNRTEDIFFCCVDLSYILINLMLFLWKLLQM